MKPMTRTIAKSAGFVPTAPDPVPRMSRSFVGRVGLDVLGQWGARAGIAWIGLLTAMAVFAPFVASSHPILIKSDAGWSSPMLQHLTPTDVVLVIASVAVVVMSLVRRVALGSRAAVVIWVVAVSVPLASWAVVGRSWSQWRQTLGLPVLITIVAVAGVLLLAMILLVAIASRARARVKVAVLGSVIPLAVLLIVCPVAPPRAIVYSAYREAEAAGQLDFILRTVIPFSPNDRMRDLPDTRLEAPTATHLMGTSAHGEDLASRMIHAARIALSIGFIATGIGMVIGVIVGGLMGYFSGWVDLIGMRLVEVFSAIPTIFLLIAFVAFYGRNLYLLMAIIGLTSWVGYALFTRAEFLKLRQQDFVQAARACGLPLRSILFRHMLPNGIAPVLVSASFGVAGAILTESVLSFLGLGLVEEPSWGQMLEQARGVGGSFFWWIALFPGLAIFLTVFAYNLVGEALRDAIDPRMQQPAQ